MAQIGSSRHSRAGGNPVLHILHSDTIPLSKISFFFPFAAKSKIKAHPKHPVLDTFPFERTAKGR